MIKFIDLFCGIGGFRLGLEKTNKIGEHSKLRIRNKERQLKQHIKSRRISERSSSPYRCVWSCDNNKYTNQVHRYHYGKQNHYIKDIRTIDPFSIPDFDLLCAGFPCQSFSLAGKRKGFKDTRGTLFYEICRIAEAKRPLLLLLENVRGLLSNDRGKTFKTILQELGNIGYWSEWQIFNSKHHGVPQNRERVFIIGHLGEGGGREIFPIGQSCETFTEQQRGIPQRNLPTIFASQHKIARGMPMIVQPTLTPDREKKRQHGRRFKENGEPMFTLTGQDIHGISFNRSRIRRLTPIECERLQGFPDDWTKKGLDMQGNLIPISDTQRYKMLGNAVTTNVIQFLGGHLNEREKYGKN